MGFRCILIPSTDAKDCALRLDAAISLSRRTEAHIRLLFVRGDPEVICANLPDVISAAGVSVQQIRDEGAREAARSREGFERACAKAGLRSDGRFTDLRTAFGSWGEQIGDLEPAVSLAGRVSDLVVVNRPSGTDYDSGRIFDTAAFSCGRPVLVVGERVPDDLLRHVVVAWNGSLEGARLVGHSIDLLRNAEQVSIVTTGSSGARGSIPHDFRDYLIWHGIHAREILATGTSEGEAHALLDAATRHGATMLAMGAYTHDRVFQLFLGGVTRHMLAHATMPLLMEH